ncbi:NADH dehydrogenase subunit 1 [Nowakowskiella sp. JEL0078]|nr:NADH dehydrogenase subunit 1 [Nowakowskiella sp. JEL0078]
MREILPLDYGLAVSELVGGGLLIIVAISELSIYGIIYSGWSANSKYPFIGSLRSVAQMISYSVKIVSAQQSIGLIWALFPMALLFMISAVSECNRPPFDLPEAESELVAGYFTEHSAIGFVYFF